MTLTPRSDGAGPLRPEPIGRLADAEAARRATGTALLALGTLACPECDAPVRLATPAVTPDAPLGCPFCGHSAAVRDFLSLATPVRPARVEVRVAVRAA